MYYILCNKAQGSKSKDKPCIGLYSGSEILDRLEAQKISGTFVKKDMETGQHFGISPIENMVFINLNKHIVVANGTDEAVISGLRKGMHVDINHEHSYIVDDESGSTLELSCNNYSYVAQHNEMKVYLKAYGCHDSVISIKFIEEI